MSRVDCLVLCEESTLNFHARAGFLMTRTSTSGVHHHVNPNGSPAARSSVTSWLTRKIPNTFMAVKQQSRVMAVHAPIARMAT